MKRKQRLVIKRKVFPVNSNNQYSIFPKMVNDATTEPMFLGNNINVQRYDKQKYEFFDKMYENKSASSGDLMKLT